LIVRGGPDNGARVRVDKGVTIVGRHPTGDVIVDDPTVSRRHAEIVRTPDGWAVKDLVSKNGTFVNQRNIRDRLQRLEDGDEIRLGTSHISLIYRQSSSPPDSDWPATPEPIKAPSDGASTAADSGGEAHTTQSAITEINRAFQGERPQGVGGPAGAELYGGTVRLRVVAEGDPQDLPALIAELRSKPQLRVLEVVSTSLRYAGILITLWEPLPLVNVLAEINGVSSVSPVEVRDDGDGPGEDTKDGEGHSQDILVVAGPAAIGSSLIPKAPANGSGRVAGQPPPLDLQLTKLLLHPDEPLLQLG